MIGQDVVDDAARSLGFDLVGVVSGNGDQRLPQRPAAAARPGRFIDVDGGTERLPAVALEERPGDRQVARGIADPGGAEVDDGAQAAVLDQKVAPGDVSVEPDGRPLPGGGKGRIPDSGGRLGVDLPLQRLECFPCLVVIHAQRSAAEEIVLARGRPARRIDPPERNEELGQIDRELSAIGDFGGLGCFAVDPAVDGPLPGVVLPRLAHRQWNRDRQRQKRRQPGQPAVLFFDLQGIWCGTRQPHSHIIAEVEGSVVPAAKRHRPHRQMPPLRKLRGDQPAHEIGIDGRFWIRHVIVSNCRAAFLDDEAQWGNSSPISR
ncbi:hypothetical protein X763_16185 [Mesorhizobium sp. LSHC432A00]|nr:hypothetical protein X763_16185 [Mesorhizobium sp. LSHC432A00]